MSRILPAILITIAWTILGCLVLKYSGLGTPDSKDFGFYSTLAIAAPVGIYCTFAIARALNGHFQYSLMMGMLCALPVAMAASLTAGSVQNAARQEVLEAAGLNVHLAEYLAAPAGETPTAGGGLKGKY